MKILVFVLVVLLSACGRIETGNVGVRTDFNKTIETTEIQPGWYGAFLTSVTEYVTKETELTLDNLRPKARDNLSLSDLDISVFYTVNPGNVAEMVIKYAGMSIAENDKEEEGSNVLHYPAYKLIERISRGAVYDSIAQYESLTLHTKRSEIESDITTKIQSDLDSTDPGVFKITKVVIRQAITDPALEKSIQAAVQMQKQVEAKRNELELAKAEAERKEVEAQGVANANRIIAESLTDKYLQFKQIEAMEHFAGEGTHTVLMPTGVTPLVNIK